jgi:hypothetical protein
MGWFDQKYTELGILNWNQSYNTFFGVIYADINVSSDEIVNYVKKLHKMWPWRQCQFQTFFIHQLCRGIISYSLGLIMLVVILLSVI